MQYCNWKNELSTLCFMFKAKFHPKRKNNVKNKLNFLFNKIRLVFLILPKPLMMLVELWPVQLFMLYVYLFWVLINFFDYLLGGCNFGNGFVLFVLFYLCKCFFFWIKNLFWILINFRYGLSITYFIIIGDQLDRCMDINL